MLKCPICGQPVALTGDGRIIPHNTSFIFNQRERRKRCPGGLRQPLILKGAPNRG